MSIVFLTNPALERCLSVAPKRKGTVFIRVQRCLAKTYLVPDSIISRVCQFGCLYRQPRVSGHARGWLRVPATKVSVEIRAPRYLPVKIDLQTEASHERLQG